MSDHVYKIIEIVGTSREGTDAAIKAGLRRAHKTVRHMRWFEVINQRGYADDEGKLQFQVTLKIGFTLDD